MMLIKNVKCRFQPFVSRSTRAKLTSSGRVRIGEISTTTWDITGHEFATGLTRRWLQCDKFFDWTIDQLATDGLKVRQLNTCNQGSGIEDTNAPWPKSASIKYVIGERWYIHCHQPSSLKGCKTPSLYTLWLAVPPMGSRRDCRDTHNIMVSEKRKENTRPAISAVGLIEATSNAMVV